MSHAERITCNGARRAFLPAENPACQVLGWGGLRAREAPFALNCRLDHPSDKCKPFL
jgi:hypothetical protein